MCHNWAGYYWYLKDAIFTRSHVIHFESPDRKQYFGHRQSLDGVGEERRVIFRQRSLQAGAHTHVQWTPMVWSSRWGTETCGMTAAVTGSDSFHSQPLHWENPPTSGDPERIQTEPGLCQRWRKGDHRKINAAGNLRTPWRGRSTRRWRWEMKDFRSQTCWESNFWRRPRLPTLPTAHRSVLGIIRHTLCSFSICLLNKRTDRSNEYTFFFADLEKNNVCHPLIVTV